MLILEKSFITTALTTRAPGSARGPGHKSSARSLKVQWGSMQIGFLGHTLKSWGHSTFFPEEEEL